jgi:MATE family multidrug resistance protein
MQCSWIIPWVTYIILFPIYIVATPILKLLGHEDDVSDIAGNFTILIIPQLFLLAINFPAQMFAQCFLFCVFQICI